MNVYDSERMADILAPLGYGLADSYEFADMVILNTCHIREKADDKVYSELGRLRNIKTRRQQSGGDMIIAVAGCVAQAEGEEIIRRAPYVNMVFGPQTYHRLPEMVAQATRATGAILDTDFPVESKFDYLPEVDSKGNVTAFLAIQEGCDKFCSFCVVPYTRGAEFSRPVQSVLHDIRQFVASGVREITLLGQNVNNYHGSYEDGASQNDKARESGASQNDKVWGLGKLITEMAQIEGLDRIRYFTSYPAEVDDALIAAHRDVPQLMPYLHLPVQSGSDRVLKAMNRRHTSGQYRELVDKLKIAKPDLALTSDFIVGFPGETDKDFEETMQLIADIGYIQAYSFKYSPRPGTPAAASELQVPEDVKTERLAALQALLGQQQKTFNTQTIGKTLPVLLENSGRNPGQLFGRSPFLQAVHVTAPDSLIGSIVDIEIIGATKNSLTGILASSQTHDQNDYFDQGHQDHQDHQDHPGPQTQRISA